MMKKIISLTLCLLMLVPVFASCSTASDEDPGAYISMYLTEPVYNFDPAYAYGNEAALKVVSLLFDNLFVLGENGKVQKSLAKSYKIIENEDLGEYKMLIEIKDTVWSDGISLQASDVVDAWTRILRADNSFDAAVLLYDIKNAKEAKQGDVSIDDVGISAPSQNEIEIYFTGKIDYDQFLLKLTSYALAPIKLNDTTRLEDITDWAKKPTRFATSGPFRLREVSYEKDAEGLVLERNLNYRRDAEKDAIDKYVKAYRLIVDYSKTPEQIMEAYNNGEIFYVGNIPLSVRGDWKDKVDTSDALSTHSYMINENAVIKRVDGKDGEKIFANAAVRNALSLALDRQAIADTVVFAKPATGLVPDGVYDSSSKRNTFRNKGEDLIASNANMDAAKSLLREAGITPSDYEFSISVPSYDEVHMAIANSAKDAWTALGFKVNIDAIDVIVNTHEDTQTEQSIDGIRDDIFAERYARGEYEIAAIDYTALSVDPFTVLAPFAKGYTGRAATTEGSFEYTIPGHITGYNNEKYNAQIEAAYAEKDAKARATKLHEAEKTLMEDMPIIPVVFNVNATLTSKKLTGEKVSYYGTPIFTTLKLKNYKKYLPEEE